jgi:hypothetical protein
MRSIYILYDIYQSPLSHLILFHIHYTHHNTTQHNTQRTTQHIPVLSDGQVLGSIASAALATEVVAALRALKSGQVVLPGEPGLLRAAGAGPGGGPGNGQGFGFGLTAPSILDPTLEIAYYPWQPSTHKAGFAYPGKI